ncbi:hypothetical protein Q669_05220 [Labrenzia sp. C1B10]|jgi:hypothetical protein|nr:hypothetical protein Q669_05220 [Labrenzia sp. C1B10]ERS04895.1 hypothetical protein Q675_00690 [Labrenzia sp. C1B70]
MNWNNPVALDVLAFAVGLNDDSRAAVFTR